MIAKVLYSCKSVGTEPYRSAPVTGTIIRFMAPKAMFYSPRTARRRFMHILVGLWSGSQFSVALMG